MDTDLSISYNLAYHQVLFIFVFSKVLVHGHTKTDGGVGLAHGHVQY
jgi:hypothetical protein